MAFTGWSPAAVEFFEGLRADNSKAYWNAHKEFYETSVRGPMEELLDELSREFGPGGSPGRTGTSGSGPTSRRTRPRSMRPWTAAWLRTATAKDRVTGFLRTAAPLHRWLDQQVGPAPA